MKYAQEQILSGIFCFRACKGLAKTGLGWVSPYVGCKVLLLFDVQAGGLWAGRVWSGVIRTIATEGVCVVPLLVVVR